MMGLVGGCFLPCRDRQVGQNGAPKMGSDAALIIASGHEIGSAQTFFEVSEGAFCYGNARGRLESG